MAMLPLARLPPGPDAASFIAPSQSLRNDSIGFTPLARRAGT
jgi:hypothetical protein